MAIHPAELTHHARDDRSWDAGLHAEGAQGPIDVGLSLEPDALGVVVDAPGLGRLKVAFQLEDGGPTRLLRASRRLADGRELAVYSDETRATRLEGELQALQAGLERQAGELDAARARAAALAEQQERLERRLAEAEAGWAVERRDLLAQQEAERDQRLVALGERERARADLERAREELDAGSATLMRELTQARAGREAAEAERSRLSGELAEASGRLQALGQEHDGLLQAHQGVAQQLEAARQAHQAEQQAHARLRQEHGALGHEHQAVLAGRAELEQEVLSSQAEVERQGDLARSLEAAVAVAHEELARLKGELNRSSESLAGIQAQSSQEAQGLRGEKEQVEAARAQLASRVRTLEAELRTREMSETTLRRKLEALGAAARGADAAQAEQQRLLEEARSQAERLEARAAEEQRGTAEAREVARQLKAQLDLAAQEREEARGIARALHARAASLPALEAELAQLKAATTAERQRLGLQIESLGRQLDQERTARARVLSELDALKRRPPAASPPSPPGALGEHPEDTRPFLVPKGLLEAAQLTNPGVKTPTGKKKP